MFVIKRLGIRVDGQEGRLSHTGERLGSLVGLTWYYVTGAPLSREGTQVLGGHWTHAHQMRRELACSLNSFWQHIHRLGDQERRPLPRKIRRELVQCLSLLPLLQVDLRTPPSGTITASDASETGGGVCYSHCLSPSGRLAFEADMAVVPAVGRDAIGLLSLCDGIGGLRRSLEVLGVEVAVYGSAEVDPRAARVV